MQIFLVSMSGGIYLLAILFLHEYINISAFTLKFFFKTLMIVGASWGFLQILKFLYHLAYPTKTQEVMDLIKERKKIKMRQFDQGEGGNVRQRGYRATY